MTKQAAFDKKENRMTKRVLIIIPLIFFLSLLIISSVGYAQDSCDSAPPPIPGPGGDHPDDTLKINGINGNKWGQRPFFNASSVVFLLSMS
jgi:hypothetical protein